MATSASPQPEVTRLLTTGRPTADDEFAEFFTSTWPRLFRTAYAVSGDRSAAEDALQSAYTKAYASWRRVSAAAQPEAYVRRMVVNEILGHRRRPWFRREQPTGDPSVAAEAPTDPSAEAVTDDRDALWRAVLALPPRQRAVVVLRYYEQLSEVEIAEVLGCSRGTVKSQASDALANLRRRGSLSPIGDGDGVPE